MHTTRLFTVRKANYVIRITSVIFMTLVIAAPLTSIAGTVAPPDTPDRGQVLFWSQAACETNFRAMETLFPSNVVPAGGHVHALPKGKPLLPRWTDHQTLDAYMSSRHIAGIMVLEHGKVRLERYGAGFGPSQRWTSFSVAKSFTSTLVGAALRDGAIRSLDDNVARYLPQLQGSAYDGVSVRQLLTMTSGVAWNEDYADPSSDVARMYTAARVPGEPRLLTYMKRLPRSVAPGTRWHYSTGETDLLGILVTHATGKTLAAYLSEKIWRPYGMGEDARWLKDAVDLTESGGSGISATLADYARMGQFILDGGRIHNHAVLADNWVADATGKHEDIGSPGMGYGYQWWTYDNGDAAGIGIFGQLLYIDRQHQLVIVQLAAWPVASDPEQMAARQSFIQAVVRAATPTPR
jgi:CubicO group peptidase (beta-lactamase class C family)